MAWSDYMNLIEIFRAIAIILLEYSLQTIILTVNPLVKRIMKMHDAKNPAYS